MDYKEFVKKILSKDLFLQHFLLLGMFSEQGPTKSSSLGIEKYNEASISTSFEEVIEKIRCIIGNHITSFITARNFLFCNFKNGIPCL